MKFGTDENPGAFSFANLFEIFDQMRHNGVPVASHELDVFGLSVFRELAKFQSTIK
jgi:hypothetical protein